MTKFVSKADRVTSSQKIFFLPVLSFIFLIIAPCLSFGRADTIPPYPSSPLRDLICGDENGKMTWIIDEPPQTEKNYSVEMADYDTYNDIDPDATNRVILGVLSLAEPPALEIIIAKDDYFVHQENLIQPFDVSTLQSFGMATVWWMKGLLIRIMTAYVMSSMNVPTIHS
ncbi:MAG: hypothetical protein AAF960_23530 [Bacteroidota bacterium]